ncbi:MAG: hypothetical protein ACR2GD_02985 [Pyrinomonadaceae bacterium]
MKNSKLISLLVILRMILTLPVLGCNRAKTSESSSLPVKDSSNNLLQISPSIQSTTNKNSYESKDLTFLREWIGKYPINKGSKKFANFFEIPQVKNILTDILGQDGFQNLLKHFAAPVLIEEKDGFLKVFGLTARNARQDVDYGLVAIKLKTGETHVFFVDDGKLTGFSNVAGNGSLPIEVKETSLSYTGQASLVGTIKQRPEDGYGCYAVLPKDWDAEWDKRPYIFYITDNGGVTPDNGKMNIEGKDVKLKVKSQTEKKEEGGKTYVDWVYENENVRAHFEMEISERLDSSAVVYDGRVIVSTYSKMQTVQIKAFCGG